MGSGFGGRRTYEILWLTDENIEGLHNIFNRLLYTSFPDSPTGYKNIYHHHV